ncbi:hypothetical protein RYX36_028076 [Vicia faba]
MFHKPPISTIASIDQITPPSLPSTVTMSTANKDFQGVSNCYVFKSRLQESTVIVNEVRYDSLPGFFNRKAAEQSAAEVALMELAKSSEVNHSITQPVHETGLCKNLL